MKDGTVALYEPPGTNGAEAPMIVMHE